MEEETVQKLIGCYQGIKDLYDGLRRYLDIEREILKTGDFDKLETMLPERAGYFLQMTSSKEEIQKLRAEIRSMELQNEQRQSLNEVIQEVQSSFEATLTANVENINILEEKKNRLKAKLYVLPKQRTALRAYEKTARRYTRERW